MTPKKNKSSNFGVQKKTQSVTGTSIQIPKFLASKLSCKLNVLNQNQPRDNRESVRFGNVNSTEIGWASYFTVNNKSIGESLSL